MAAQFLLGLKEKRNLAQVAVNDIKDGCKLIIDNVKDNVKKECIARIENEPNITEKPIVIKHIRNAVNLTVDPFDCLGSTYKQKKYLEKNYKFIEPREIILGEIAQMVHQNGQEVLNIKNDKFYYISIIESIKQFLQNKKILRMVMENREPCPHELLLDVWDGSNMRAMQFENDVNYIFFEIYYDDLEVCNPLGSRTENLGMFYYRIANIDVLYRSKLSAIRLWAVVKSKNIKKYGMDNILRPLVADFKTMSNGWEMNVDGQVIRFKGFLNSVIADTPAANSLLGFKEGVGGAFDKCRRCQCTNPDMQTKFREEDFTALTQQNYIQKCRALRQAGTKGLQERLKTVYGINRETMLLQCPNFNIIDHTPFDIMHVMLEGIIPYEVKQVLCKLIMEDNAFNLYDLNDEIKIYFSSFRYDTMSRPSELTASILNGPDNTLRQSSDQMLVLLRALPFILAILIEIRSAEFQLVKQLLEITNILFSTVISLGTLDLLRGMIHTHLTQFKTMFPECNIIPKQHFLIHMPTIIEKTGPPIRTSASRFESKNKGHKKNVQVWQNFKNVPYSVAQAAQRQECLANECEADDMHPLFASEIETSKTFRAPNMVHIKNKLTNFYGIDEDSVESAFESKTVALQGNKFICDYSFVAVDSSDYLIQFGKLKHIYFVNTREIFFEVQMFETVNFDDDFQSFIVQVNEPDMPEGTILIKPEDLVDYNSYFPYNFDDNIYLQVPYDIFGVIELSEHHLEKLHNRYSKI